MRILLVALNAKYAHKGPAVWMLREACARRGLAVRVLETENSRPLGELARDIARLRPDVAAFSVSIWNIASIRRLTPLVRAMLPGTAILWGGPEVSYDAPRRIKEPDAPDAILAGEGEEAFPAFLLRLIKGEGMEGPGVITPTFDGGIAPPVPQEHWIHLYPPGALAEPHRLHYVETSRGCPFACRYCLSSVQGPVRALPAEEALRRLLLARDAGARTVKVLDRTFNFDSPRARTIWRGLIKEGGESTYHFEIAAHLLGQEDIDVLLAAPPGLFQMEIGVQTTCQAALEAIGRGQDWAALASAVSALRAKGNIHLHLDLIAGLPGDTLSSFSRAVDQVLSLRPHALQLGFLKLLPGSPLRQEFETLGYPFDPYPPYEVVSTAQLSAGDLSHLHDVEAALSHFYNSGAFSGTSQRWLASFAPLSALARSLREEGFFDAPRSLVARFDALHRALPASAEPDLRHDWLASGQREYRPWMRPHPRPEALRSLNLDARTRHRAHAERIAGRTIAFLPGKPPRTLQWDD